MTGLREFEYYEKQYSYKQYERDLSEEEYWDEILAEDEDVISPENNPKK